MFTTLNTTEKKTQQNQKSSKSCKKQVKNHRSGGNEGNEWRKDHYLQVLKSYQKRVDASITSYCSHFDSHDKLGEACAYALNSGGKRFRSIIVIMIAEALKGAKYGEKASLAVELFHTASLIADDLPCMDNDDQRRGKPSTHKVYGESTALLATYALIAAGYDCLHQECSEKVCQQALICVTKNTGLLGVTGGQYLDLFAKDFSEESIREIMSKKTRTLFETAFVLGWLYGGGEIAKIPLVEKMAFHYGMAFQIADDLKDEAEDIKNKREINCFLALGKEKAMAMLKQELDGFFQKIEELGLENSHLHYLGEFLKKDL